MGLQKRQYHELIDHWIARVDVSDCSVQEKAQKTMELCHFASFCIALKNEGYIDSFDEIRLINLDEAPDFEIEFQGRSVGLEVCQATNSSVSIINNQRDILRKVKNSILQERPDITLNLNVVFNDININRRNKPDYTKKTVRAVVEFVDNKGELILPDFIKKIRAYRSDTLSVDLAGSYWVDCSHDSLYEVIKKKEKRLEKYRASAKYSEFWLLVVIHGNSPESDFLNLNDFVNSIETNFDHFFILNEFKKSLHCKKVLLI